jgi:hypothetical protein
MAGRAQESGSATGKRGFQLLTYLVKSSTSQIIATLLSCPSSALQKSSVVPILSLNAPQCNCAPTQARTPLVALVDVDLVLSRQLTERFADQQRVDQMMDEVRAAT